MSIDSASPTSLGDSEATLLFVAHGGPLEAKSALLAASLSKYYRPGKIACSIMEPVERWGSVSPAFEALMELIGVRIVHNVNELDLDYPHGNKVSSLRGVSGPAIFLDSDILLTSPFSWHYRLTGDCCVCPADVDMFTRGGASWARIWEIFNLDLPEKSYSASVTGEPMRPYFNAGFIAVKDGDQFADMWTDTAQKIDADQGIINKRPWLDQLALPVTFARLGWEVSELSELFNYPCHLSPIEGATPYFAHYHWPRVIENSPPLRWLTAQLITEFPLLQQILGKYPEWETLLASPDG